MGAPNPKPHTQERQRLPHRTRLRSRIRPRGPDTERDSETDPQGGRGGGIQFLRDGKCTETVRSSSSTGICIGSFGAHDRHGHGISFARILLFSEVCVHKDVDVRSLRLLCPLPHCPLGRSRPLARSLVLSFARSLVLSLALLLARHE